MIDKNSLLSKLKLNKPQNDKGHPNAVRTGVWVLLAFVFGLIIWAAFAPLDEGVPSEGIITIATKSKVIQHLQGGRIKQVHVREGQMVNAGDVLITLDDQMVKARYQEVHQHYLGLRAAESRLLAEQSGARKIEFHPDLLNDENRLLTQRLMNSERKMFIARQNIIRRMHVQLSGIKSLVREGYVPLNEQLELENRLDELNGKIEEEMSQVQREVQADREKSDALAQEFEMMTIKAPVSGQVMGLQVQTPGAVIQPAQILMEIVPMNEKLLIEVKIAPHLIDRVHAGGEADVRFTSFAHSPNLVVEGKVKSVSKDLIVDPKMNPAQPGSSYYLALVSITPEGMKMLGKRQLQPGMHVQAVIKTGERSMLTYLMHPLVKRISASMKEE